MPNYIDHNKVVKMSIQLDFLEKDISNQLYSLSGWMGRMQKKLERITAQQELILSYRKLTEKPKGKKTNVLQLDFLEPKENKR
jgi:flagellar biosynthesis chaperone FliJ